MSHGSLKDYVVTSHGASVGGGSTLSCAGSSDFHQQYRFLGRNLLCRFEKSGSIAESLDIQDDDASFEVCAEEFDVVGAGEDGFVAGADGGADTESPALEGDEVLGHEGAALGDEGDGSGGGCVGHGGEVEVEGRAAHADAVRTYHVEFVFLGDGFDFVFSGFAFGSHFPIATGDEDDVADIRLGTLVENFVNCRFRNNNSGKVGSGAV